MFHLSRYILPVITLILAGFVTPASAANPTLTAFTVINGGNEGSNVIISRALLAAAGNEADADGGTINFKLTSTLGNTMSAGTGSVLSTGSWTWMPPADANGVIDAFQVVAIDPDMNESPNPVTVRIQLNPVNDPPTFLAGPNVVRDEDAGAVTIPNWAMSIFPGPPNESSQTVTFDVSTNSPLFSVAPAVSSNGTLTFTTAPDANGTAIISINARDDGGTANGGVDVSSIQTFTITLNPVPDPPVVTAVSSFNANGSYWSGTSILIDVIFSHPVHMNSFGGDPTLSLNSGGTASYAGGSGTSTLKFLYTVLPGHNSPDLDYLSTSALALNGATIRDEENTDAIRTLPAPGTAGSLGANNAIIIDTVNPSVTSVTVPANGTYRTTQNLDFTVNYSENVNVSTTGGTPRIAITLNTGGTVYANYQSGSGTSALVFRYTVLPGHRDHDGVTVGELSYNSGVIRDAAYNNASVTLNNVGSTTGVRVDGIPASVSSVGVPLPYTFKNGENIDLTVIFSEPVYITGSPSIDILLDHGGSIPAIYSSGSGSNVLIFRSTITPGLADTTGVTISPAINLNSGTITDDPGNTAILTLNNIGNTSGVLVDSSPPTLLAAIPDQTLVIGEPAVTIDLDDHFTDLGNPTLIYAVTGGTDTTKVSTSINGSILTLAALANGTTSVTIEASDINGGIITDTFDVTIGTADPTALQLATTATYNNQTSLFEITVNVTNTTPYPINGFRLGADFASYLAAHPSLRLYNATLTTAPGAAYVDHPFPVAVDATVPVRLAFYTSTRLFPAPFAPVLTVGSLSTAQLPHNDGSGVQAGIVNLPDLTKLIEFPSEIGKWYRVRYSSDLANWYDSPVPLQAGATRMQWIDSGPPFTDSPPSNVPSRYYTVLEIPAP